MSLDLVCEIFGNFFVYIVESEVSWFYIFIDNFFGFFCYDDMIDVIVEFVEYIFVFYKEY